MDTTKVCLLLVLLPSLSLACSCVAPLPTEKDTLRQSFCSGPVYAGRVVAATCSCSVNDSRREDGGVFVCHEYRLDGGGAAEVVSYDSVNRVFCARPDAYGVGLCSKTLEGVAGGLATRNLTGDLPAPTNDTDNIQCGHACPLNNATDTNFNIQPCFYTIQITETFNVNADYMIGDNVTSPGPDVLTSCGQYGRVLTLGEEYVAVGGTCGGIGLWPTLAELGPSNIEFLRTLMTVNQTNPRFCAASTILLLPSLVATLVGLTTVALV